MFKRLFWLVVGFALGLGSSWAVTRRLRRIAARYAPTEVVDRWSGTCGRRSTRDAPRCGPAKPSSKRAWREGPGSSLNLMSERPTTADELRRAFVDFFVARGHTRSRRRA